MREDAVTPLNPLRRLPSLCSHPRLFLRSSLAPRWPLMMENNHAARTNLLRLELEDTHMTAEYRGRPNLSGRTLPGIH
jgi:hypothetical protein